MKHLRHMMALLPLLVTFALAGCDMFAEEEDEGGGCALCLQLGRLYQRGCAEAV